ncbi:MAG: methionyl-tRNA formyltransferase [Planctomycetota bacterium]
MSDTTAYLLAGCRPWNRRTFEQLGATLPGEWHFVGERDELTAARVRELAPRYCFFLHWSWKVPAEIVAHECVAFHMTDLPYGRGGSPLQNLIVRGHRDTMLSALRMTADFDAGPVYLKRPLSLEGGSAEELYLRTDRLAAEMIAEIIHTRPEPQPQTGDPTIFPRRTPDDSRITGDVASLPALHDFIRMLDADGYPPAFIEQAGFRLEFRRSTLRDGRIEADVTIRSIDDDHRAGDDA